MHETDMTEVMGLGAAGEVREGPDGQLYEWVEGIDGLGNPVGFWKSIKKLARRGRRLARRGVRLATRASRYLPGPYGRLVSTGLKRGSPWLRRAGLLGLGELYEADDGSVYTVEGLDEDDGYEAVDGLGADELEQVMGIGTLGEVREGPDGDLYEWTEGIDGLGNTVGFWKKLKKFARRARRVGRRFARRALPLVQRYSKYVPGYGTAISAGLRTASPYLRRAGLLGEDGPVEPDGALYPVDGLEDDYEGAEVDGLDGLDEDDTVEGYESGRSPAGQSSEFFRPLW